MTTSADALGPISPPEPDEDPPSAPENLAASAASETQINLGWSASSDNVGVVGYSIWRCTGSGCTDFSSIGTSGGPGYNDYTVNAAVTYRYQVYAYDAVDNWSGPSNASSATTPDTHAPGAPGNLVASAASSTQIDLSWIGSSDNVGVAGYNIERCIGSACTGFAPLATTASTNFSDSGLTTGTSYSYRVFATDASGNPSSYSNTATATPPDTQPPTSPSALSATAISGTQINLSWTKSVDNVGVKNYLIERCTGTACSNFSQTTTTASTSLGDSGLASATTYVYRVRAIDEAGNRSGYSNNASAKTPDKQAPDAPTGLTSTVVSTSQIDLSWNVPFDNVGVKGYRVDRCMGANCTTFSQIGLPSTPKLSDTGLSKATTYRYQVRATDAAGNWGAYSTIVAAKTKDVPDTEPPAAPTGLVPAVVSSTQVNLTWVAATDNGAVVGYRVERCKGKTCTAFTEIGSPSTTTYSDTGLTAATPYRYQVRAVDAAGNVGPYSAIASTVTQEKPDTLPPGAPAAVTPTAVSSTQINLIWTSAPDDSGVTTYRVERCEGSTCTNFTVIGTSTSTAFNDTSLSASTTYRYRIQASDAANNVGPYSSIVFTSTLSQSNGNISFVQSGWSASQTTDSSATVKFHAAQTAGNLNVVVVGWRAMRASITSVVDAKGNVYSPAVGPHFTADFRTQYIFYAKNIVSAAGDENRVTVTMNVAVPNLDLRIAEYSGLSVSVPIDVTAGAAANGASLNSGSVNTTNSNDLLFAATYVETATSGVGANYVQRLLTTNGSNIQDRIVTSVGAYNATATQTSGNWIMQMVAFKGSGGGGDTVAPSGPGSIVLNVVSTSQINLSWGVATDNVGVTGYRVDRCAGSNCTIFVQVGSVTGTAFTDTGLRPSTLYRYRVRANDVVNNVGPYSAIASATTQDPPDIVAPTAPSGLDATSPTSTRMDLSWIASGDDVGVTGYRIERCTGQNCTSFLQIATTDATSFGDSGLSASTPYRYRVLAFDAATNVSEYSNIVSATTQLPPDITPPNAPASLTGKAMFSRRVDLAWAAATDDRGVAGYRIERCIGGGCANFTLVANSTALTFSDTTTGSATMYQYRVQAFDKAGNIGPSSNVVSVTTPAGSETIAYGYDAKGRLVKVVHSAGANNGVESSYTYDKANNRKSEATTGAH